MLFFSFCNVAVSSLPFFFNHLFPLYRQCDNCVFTGDNKCVDIGPDTSLAPTVSPTDSPTTPIPTTSPTTGVPTVAKSVVCDNCNGKLKQTDRSQCDKCFNCIYISAEKKCIEETGAPTNSPTAPTTGAPTAKPTDAPTLRRAGAEYEDGEEDDEDNSEKRAKKVFYYSLGIGGVLFAGVALTLLLKHEMPDDKFAPKKSKHQSEGMRKTERLA